jgi:hypothetical protein
LIDERRCDGGQAVGWREGCRMLNHTKSRRTLSTACRTLAAGVAVRKHGSDPCQRGTDERQHRPALGCLLPARLGSISLRQRLRIRAWPRAAARRQFSQSRMTAVRTASSAGTAAGISRLTRTRCVPSPEAIGGPCQSPRAIARRLAKVFPPSRATRETDRSSIRTEPGRA